MKAPGPKPRKQPYKSPVLVTYGNLAALTESRRRGRAKDGGKGAKARTR
jgi:hypothetical protein